MKKLGCLAVAGILVLCFGIGLVALGVELLVRARASLEWPTTDGQILSSELNSYHVKSGDGTTLKYRPEISYRYWVGNKVYTGNRVSLIDPGSTDRKNVEDTVARYPVNSSVVVYYDATRPGWAVLEPGTTSANRTVLLAGIFFIVGGLFITAVNYYIEHRHASVQ